MTTGEILFYVGIAGMAAVAVISVIVTAALASGRKRLRKKFEKETRK